jgi:hypothetical protein
VFKEMSNGKIRMPNQAQNPNNKNTVDKAGLDI